MTNSLNAALMTALEYMAATWPGALALMDDPTEPSAFEAETEKARKIAGRGKARTESRSEFPLHVWDEVFATEYGLDRPNSTIGGETGLFVYYLAKSKESLRRSDMRPRYSSPSGALPGVFLRASPRRRGERHPEARSRRTGAKAAKPMQPGDTISRFGGNRTGPLRFDATALPATRGTPA